MEATITPPMPPKVFRVLVSAPGLEFGDVIASVFPKVLPAHSVKVTSSSANSLAVLLADPELKPAHLVIVLIDNLRTVNAKDPKAFEERCSFVRDLRCSTNGIILITSGIWSDGIRAAYLDAGADIAERMPFSVTLIGEAVARALPLI